jgi:hypothetical protein
MMLTLLVSRPKQPVDRIDVYFRPLVDDLKILWKPGVPEVWDEYKREGFTMHGMLFTTINDNPAQRNLSGPIDEIWELDYVGLKVALFQCRWVTNGKRAVSKDKYGYVSVDLWVFGYKNELFVFANDVEQVFYVPDLAKKNWFVVMPGKKGLWGLKMLLLRRNTTSLTKFHPLTLHTSPSSWELTKHRPCEVTIVKKSIYRNQGIKSKPDFY